MIRLWTGFNRGDLFKKVQQRNWDVALSFAASQQDFCDVQVITLKQYLYDLAADEAHNRHVDLNNIDSYIDYLVRTKYYSAREFVLVTHDKITVGINTDKVDDHAVDYAKTLLIQMQSFESGIQQEFGQEIKIYDTSKNK